MSRIGFNKSLTVFLSLFLVTLATAQAPPTTVQAPPGSYTPVQAPPTSLKWRAEIAKQRGITSIDITPMREGEGLLPLKQLIQNSLVVDGIVESSTVDASSGFQIFTWYRVRVLSRGPTPDFKSVFNREVAPAPIGPAKEGEILVRLEEGTVVIDGVSITDNSEPKLSEHKRYLFFLEPLPDGAFVSAKLSRPVPLDDNGQIVHSEKPGFIHRLDQFQSINDLLDYGK